MLRFNKDLFNKLSPRVHQWSLDDFVKSTENDKIILDKMEENCFINNDFIIIGDDLSWFNNSSHPNAYVRCEEINFTTFSSTTISIIAGKDIKTGDEICINYGKEDLDFVNREPKQSNRDEIITIDDADGDIIQSILLQYKKKEACRNVIKNHVCISQELFIVDGVVISTEKFTKFIENLYGTYSIDNINKWLKYVDELLA